MVRVACSPVPWGKELYERILDDVAAAGYQGIEASDDAIEAFRKQPGKLRALLDERSLALTAALYSAWFFDRQERKDEVERLRRLADFVAEVGFRSMIVMRTMPHPARRDMVAGQPPLLPLSGDRLAYLADALNQSCDALLGDFGLTGAFQNRVGTFVETPDEYQEIIDRTDPGLVYLAPDLGHWRYAGGGPAELIRLHRQRIIYPRLKDVDSKVLEKTRQERRGFASFLLDAGFRALGEGDMDLTAALMPLETAEYDGWVCVELERTGRHPKEDAAASRAFLRTNLHW